MELVNSQVNPNKSGLSPDAPKGMTVIENGDRAQPDVNGRTAVMPSAISDAQTPERRGGK